MDQVPEKLKSWDIVLSVKGPREFLSVWETATLIRLPPPCFLTQYF